MPTFNWCIKNCKAGFALGWSEKTDLLNESWCKCHWRGEKSGRHKEICMVQWRHPFNLCQINTDLKGKVSFPSCFYFFIELWQDLIICSGLMSNWRIISTNYISEPTPNPHVTLVDGNAFSFAEFHSEILNIRNMADMQKLKVVSKHLCLVYVTVHENWITQRQKGLFSASMTTTEQHPGPTLSFS